MLTENRRNYLKARNLGKGKIAEYDYRILKWLESILDPGEEGGIGDINRVLDTLDREAIRKHLKDENVYDLLNLVIRLLDILDFLPVEQTSRGQAIVSKPTGLAALASDRISVRLATDADYEKNCRLSYFANILKQHYSDPDTVEQLKCYNTMKHIKFMKDLEEGGPDEDGIEKFKEEHNMSNVPHELDPK